LVVLLALALPTPLCWPQHRLDPGALYRVKTNTPLTVSLPVSRPHGQHVFRAAGGKWAGLPVVKTEANQITFTLSPSQLDAGSTMILIGKPDWLDLNDTAPPRVEKALVDGKPVDAAEHIRLGWIDKVPATFELHVADEHNPIDPASVCVYVNGMRLAPDGDKVRLALDPRDRKRALILCALPALVAEQGAGTSRVTVHCDDFAPDESRCSVDLSFTVTRPPRIELTKPAATASDGTAIYVDSIHPGYENVECLLDGQLQVPGTTTYGKTWASKEDETDHWLCLVLPKPREVAGLAISWANYSGVDWTSARYDVMTWDGKQWRRALRVQDNPQARTSTHALPATKTDRVLVWVPAGGGHPQRPNITWMTEVKLLP